MKKMAKHLPDAGFYAPLTILMMKGLLGCIYLMTGWPVSSLPTSVLKLRSWRGNWTQNPVEPSCEFVDL